MRGFTKAKIRWFDSLRGTGLVRMPNGDSVNIHFTVIQGFDKNNYQWPSDEDQERELKNGQVCYVRLDHNKKNVTICKMGA